MFDSVKPVRDLDVTVGGRTVCDLMREVFDQLYPDVMWERQGISWESVLDQAAAFSRYVCQEAGHRKVDIVDTGTMLVVPVPKGFEPGVGVVRGRTLHLYGRDAVCRGIGCAVRQDGLSVADACAFVYATAAATFGEAFPGRRLGLAVVQMMDDTVGFTFDAILPRANTIFPETQRLLRETPGLRRAPRG